MRGEAIEGVEERVVVSSRFDVNIWFRTRDFGGDGGT